MSCHIIKRHAGGSVVNSSAIPCLMNDMSSVVRFLDGRSGPSRIESETAAVPADVRCQGTAGTQNGLAHPARREPKREKCEMNRPLQIQAYTAINRSISSSPILFPLPRVLDPYILSCSLTSSP